MRLIDSHCHLHDTDFFKDNREEVYLKAIQDEVGMICVGTDIRSSNQAVEFASDHKLVWAAVGVHPHDSKNGWGEIKAILESQKNNPKLVAVGEIGLDYFYNNSPRQLQIKALEEQIQWALDYDLPISFHVREAFDDFWPIFDNFRGVRGVLHSFTDSQDNLDKGFNRGLYVGINGISTFTRSKTQQELYRNIPLSRLLIETDAPFLTPDPFRGKMNIPSYVELVAKFWAKERGLSFDDIAKASLKNSSELFNL